ncbi:MULTISPECIES: hypothetical protein [Caproicibacterium]|uniref:Uncharacterized protein n=1 Tax=Caproicibacterium argilliputei TaxID=3030016 RepID=A0AA97DBX7_9FIRM|nr:hypothetical protein [Caproicibacterium argilliputei]WOC33447.1 hypothetical protein PXC00_06165 [Caproicibacterium argilliputei]
MSNYDDLVSDFFESYVKSPRSGYTKEGNFTEEVITAAAKLLLNEKVFESEQEMKKEALKDYGIILPAKIFKEN